MYNSLENALIGCTVYRPQYTVYGLWFMVYGLPFTAYCLLPTAYRLPILKTKKHAAKMTTCFSYSLLVVN